MDCKAITSIERVLTCSNSTQASAYRYKSSTVLIRYEDLPPAITRSIHTDIGRENTENNSIATQQNYLLDHHGTDTAMFKRYYEDRGMQTDDSYAPSAETVQPESSSESIATEVDDDASVASMVVSSVALAPENSKSKVKTPEAGDRATPQTDKDEDVPETPVATTVRATSQALVPFKEDTLWVLLHARSKLLSIVDEAKQVPEETTEETVEDAKVNTYKNMQSDIKDMITDLLLQSSEIKTDALSAGVLEDDSPPLICDFLDTYYSTASADVSYILDHILGRVDERIQKADGIGDADDIKTTLRPFIMPLGQQNVAETYFCTTSLDRIPKTSWVFGDSRKASQFAQNKRKRSGVDDDILEGSCDLLSGLYDPKEQFVCMVHNVGIKKSEKSSDLRNKLAHRAAQLSSPSATDEETVVRNTYLSYSSPSLPPPKTGQSSKSTVKKVSIQSSSSSDDCLIKAKSRAKKPVPVRVVGDLSGYESDQETGADEATDRVKRAKTKKSKSKPEVNTPEEIKKIEENVAQNSKLDVQKGKKTGL